MIISKRKLFNYAKSPTWFLFIWFISLLGYFFYIKYQSSHQLLSASNGKKKVVMVFSSVGRSGSTFVLQTLNSRLGTHVLYEPCIYLYDTPCKHFSSCLEKTLTELFTCNITTEYVQSVENLTFMIDLFYPEFSKQCLLLSSCLEKINLKENCLKAEFIVTKIIRLRIGLLEPLFLNEEIDFKLIYLVRDPRANAASIQRFGLLNHPRPFSAARMCHNYLNDITAFQTLQNLYPDRTYKLHYEKMSQDPDEHMRKLFKFAFGDESLPASVAEHVRKHTQVAQRGGMNTLRKSREHYQQWRSEIDPTTLTAVEDEEECHSILNFLGHHIFESFSNARNIEAFPLFKTSS